MRSGKTLIGRALNMHSNIVVQKEPYFFYFKLCRNIFYRDLFNKPGFDFDSPIDSDFCKSEIEKNAFRQALGKIFFKPSDIDELKRLTIKQQEAEPGERAPNILPLLKNMKVGYAPSVFKQLMDIIAEAYSKSGVQYVGITEGWCDEFIQPMLELKDIDVRCIHCLRDPRAVVASRNAKNSLQSYGGKYPLLFLIRHWRKSIAYANMNSRNPKHMTIQYEEVVQYPDIWFEKMCDFLGVPFCGSLLKPNKYIRGDGKLWKQNTSYDQNEKTAFNISSLEKWKAILTSDEVGAIEYFCKPEMDYLGLKCFNKTFKITDFDKIDEKEEDIIEWLKKYDWTLNNKGELMLEFMRKCLVESKSKAELEKLINYFFIDKIVFDSLPSNLNKKHSFR